eukprot:CAMPEP_0172534184 /NCGR_PEP_ID=MMETSP1067-20121228/6640_1 /TAXON_ID=265564 ORGANISM="Thalassiosira punctigera, Strain Tpunct2005C2" /NCGR_SAMPLE_ID=MMETSP1067 /ASSEMBLY_ACC=CAM_ASM_000444 /LENGTH=149 /DNA_ID=CAMNT_0013318947 /DNA_START=468 /DNA_END=917 /DNA_ORIENTATION=+
MTSVPPSSSSESPKTKKKVVLKKSIVDHIYRDYSRVALSDLIEGERVVNDEIFPHKLHTIISTVEYAGIVARKPHGRAWQVTDKVGFTSGVFPTHFNHNNFESFNRSVNGWGFKMCGQCNSIAMGQTKMLTTTSASCVAGRSWLGRCPD